jgi:hypothetical protein
MSTATQELELEEPETNKLPSVVLVALSMSQHLETCQTWEEKDYCACEFQYGCPICFKPVVKASHELLGAYLESETSVKENYCCSDCSNKFYEPIYDALAFVAQMRYEWAANNRCLQLKGQPPLEAVEQYISCDQEYSRNLEANLAKYRLGLANERGFQVFINGEPE